MLLGSTSMGSAMEYRVKALYWPRKSCLGSTLIERPSRILQQGDPDLSPLHLTMRSTSGDSLEVREPSLWRLQISQALAKMFKLALSSIYTFWRMVQSTWMELSHKKVNMSLRARKSFIALPNSQKSSSSKFSVATLTPLSLMKRIKSTPSERTFMAN